MRNWFGAIAAIVGLSGCPANNRCERATRASVHSSLIEASDSSVELRWSDLEDRPTFFWGNFSLVGDNHEAALRSFLRAQTQLALDEKDLRLSSQKVGKAGRYLRFSQMYQGLPVFRGEVIAHIKGDSSLRLRSLRLAQKQIKQTIDVTPNISLEKALAQAQKSLSAIKTSGEATLGVYAEPQPRLAYRVLLSQDSPLVAQEIFVDAHTGELIESRSLLKADEGVGFIFDPNPVASSGNHIISDQQDETTQFFSDERVSVPLPGLDGTGFLKGRFADVQNTTSRAQNLSLVFNFQRSDDRFEEVMAYFHVDRAQQRIQSLGFFDVNNRVQEVIVNAFAEDNSFYNPLNKRVSMGAGGVDDAEDADIIVHEYGHSIQDNQVPGFGTTEESRAMGEGFSDYLAGSFMATMTNEVTEAACIGDWDSTAYDQRNPPCLRRLDIPKHFPEHLVGEIHFDGEIWSAALFDLRQAVGADVADALALEAHFSQAVDESFAGAASTILAADEALFFGQNTQLIKRIFAERGLLRDLTPPADFSFVVDTFSVQVEPERENGVYFDANTDIQEIVIPGAQGLRLRFAQLETELNEQCVDGICDNIYLFDKQGNLFQILNGAANNLASVVIPGDTVRIHLVSDFTVGQFGYLIEQVDVMGSSPGPTCGNGTIESPESCDGLQLQGASCASLGFDSGALTCNTNCTFDASACTGQSLCGNNLIDEGEECDGANTGGQLCSAFGFDTGNVACNPDCTINTSSCSDCGDGVKSGAEACDGLDLGSTFCETVGLSSGFLRCSGACTLDTSACLPARCE
jgi:Zn-dependent metalloprotease